MSRPKKTDRENRRQYDVYVIGESKVRISLSAYSYDDAEEAASRVLGIKPAKLYAYLKWGEK